jgi:tryptophan-rich sensory protein
MKRRIDLVKSIKKQKIDLVKLGASLVVCFLAAAIGSVFTMPAIPTWYATLVKPSFAPPNWLFGPAWTTLYILMAISLYIVWVEYDKREFRRRDAIKPALMAFGAQLILNAAWSFLFFGLRSPFYGLVGIILVWLAIVWTMIKFWKISKTATWLLVPYILWVSFASILNYAVWQLNPV